MTVKPPDIWVRTPSARSIPKVLRCQLNRDFEGLFVPKQVTENISQNQTTFREWRGPSPRVGQFRRRIGSRGSSAWVPVTTYFFNRLLRVGGKEIVGLGTARLRVSYSHGTFG